MFNNMDAHVKPLVSCPSKQSAGRNIYIYISIIHLRCIREVFSDALSSLPISVISVISAPTVTPA